MAGTVYLVGAGPGDPGLLTRRAARLLRRADVVVHDALVGDRILALARPSARIVDVGKRCGERSRNQESINELLVQAARTARLVVRLKGGDPFVFGRGGEEALALGAAGVRFVVVPGVTAAVGVAAFAGIPVTHRGVSSSVTFVTAHQGRAGDVDWEALARTGGTLVFYMGVRTLDSTARNLLRAGRDPSTPAAIVEWGTHPRQRTVTATLETLAETARSRRIGAPALVIVGEVAALRDRIRWYDVGPLDGRRILVARSRAQPSRIAAALRNAGAEVVEYPRLRALPAADPRPVLSAVEHLDAYGTLVFTSPAAVRFFWSALDSLGLDARALAHARVAAFGKATVDALRRRGVRPDVSARTFAPSVVAERLAEGAELAATRVLFPREAHLESPIAARLREAGARVDEVECFRVENDPRARDPGDGDLRDVDAIVLPSSTAARMIASITSKSAGPTGPRIVAIGPVTAQEALARGLTVDAIARRNTVGGIVETLLGLWPENPMDSPAPLAPDDTAGVPISLAGPDDR